MIEKLNLITEKILSDNEIFRSYEKKFNRKRKTQLMMMLLKHDLMETRIGLEGKKKKLAPVWDHLHWYFVCCSGLPTTDICRFKGSCLCLHLFDMFEVLMNYYGIFWATKCFWSSSCSGQRMFRCFAVFARPLLYYVWFF